MNSNRKRTVVTVKLAKFKEWARCHLHPDSPLLQVIQREKDELPLDEAIVKTEIVCALIDSIDSSSLKKPRIPEVS